MITAGHTPARPGDMGGFRLEPPRIRWPCGRKTGKSPRPGDAGGACQYNPRPVKNPRGRHGRLRSSRRRGVPPADSAGRQPLVLFAQLAERSVLAAGGRRRRGSGSWRKYSAMPADLIAGELICAVKAKAAERSRPPCPCRPSASGGNQDRPFTPRSSRNRPGPEGLLVGRFRLAMSD